MTTDQTTTDLLLAARTDDNALGVLADYVEERGVDPATMLGDVLAGMESPEMPLCFCGEVAVCKGVNEACCDEHCGHTGEGEEWCSPISTPGIPVSALAAWCERVGETCWAHLKHEPLGDWDYTYRTAPATAAEILRGTDYEAVIALFGEWAGREVECKSWPILPGIGHDPYCGLCTGTGRRKIGPLVLHGLAAWYRERGTFIELPWYVGDQNRDPTDVRLAPGIEWLASAPNDDGTVGKWPYGNAWFNADSRMEGGDGPSSDLPADVFDRLAGFEEQPGSSPGRTYRTYPTLHAALTAAAVAVVSDRRSSTDDFVPV